MSKRGADLLVEGLVEGGTKRIFALSGNQIMPVFDACIDAEIELLHVRHEAAAVHMADAWGRLTGEPGVALVTGGPGHANAISALYSALMSESPMVLLSGHAPKGQLGQGAFQEMAQAAMAAPVCKAAWMVERAADFKSDMRRALALAAAGRPGPVHLSLPFDLLNESAAALDSGEEPVPAGTESIDKLAHDVAALIARAKRPLVVVGPHLMRLCGASGLQALSEDLGAPVVGSDSPRGTGDPALGAFAQVLAQADLVVALGRAVDFTLKLGRPPAVAPNAEFVLVNPCAKVLATSRRAIDDDARVALSALADMRAFVGALRERATTPPASEWTTAVVSAVRYRPAGWSTLVSQTADTLHALEVARGINTVYDEFERGTLVIDGGEFGQWAQASLQAAWQLTNGPGGSIGSAIPMAIAARVARPGESVVAVLGDGTCGFHLTEFDTAVRYGLDFVAVVGNDACWNAEYQIQLRDYGPQRLVGCELRPTRYDQIVEAMGGHGEFVTRAQDLVPALLRARGSGKPACVNVALERNPAPSVSLPAS